MTKYLDLFRQAKRMGDRIDVAEQPAVAMAYDLFLRALEKAARRPHHAERQGDEYYCYICNKRWAVDEHEEFGATDCEPLPPAHVGFLQGQIWRCTDCDATWPLGAPAPRTECV